MRLCPCRLWRLVGLVALVGGCDLVFGLDGQDAGGDGRTDDAPIDACTTGDWGPPQLLSEFESQLFDPSLRADELELFVASQNSGYDLLSTSRPSVANAFPSPTPVAGLNSSDDDTDPALTRDGTRLLFRSARTGATLMWEASRASVGAPFETPHLAAGLEAVAIGGLAVTPDGLTVYFDDNAGAGLFVARRATLAAPFGTPVLVIAAPVPFPSISGDERELYWSAPAGVMRQTRADPTSPFGIAELFYQAPAIPSSRPMARG